MPCFVGNENGEGGEEFANEQRVTLTAANALALVSTVLIRRQETI